MGIFDKLFGNTPDYPALDPSSTASRTLDSVRSTLENFMQEVTDSLEVVPSPDSTFIFIGNPPKKFGVAWIEEGKVINFKTLVDERGLSVVSLERLSDRLKEIYIANQEEPRFTAELAEKKIVIIPSEKLQQDIAKVIRETVG